ncbi:MAG: hypothetical protein ACP5K9_01355 [Candidatus Micrarchaeia archaeon]
MKYYATINKRTQNIKVYRVVKRVNENTNKLSIWFQKLVDRIFLNEKKSEI